MPAGKQSNLQGLQSSLICPDDPEAVSNCKWDLKLPADA